MSEATVTLLWGDCVEVMGKMDECSVDAIVCDPPYELGFMSKAWDQTGVAYRAATWEAALRVLKPGGHLLAFGGTRTYHRLACAIEDAGFEIRDSVMWIYGSGFPKSLNVSKAITVERSNPGSPEAQAWEGWGTAAKPAHEPIVVARKPLVGTVAKNVLEHGTGALNIDACRVGTDGGGTHCGNRGDDGRCLGHQNAGRSTSGETFHGPETSGALGRWPANIILGHAEGCVQVGTKTTTGRTINRWDDGAKPFGGGAGHPFTGEKFPDEEALVYECVEGCPVAEMDRQSGITHGNGPRKGFPGGTTFGNSGGASRFFQQVEQNLDEDAGFLYCAKAAKKERNAGVDKNAHPTVKPVALMRYLCRLVTPPGGTVLDPFLGSGTTAIAAAQEGFSCIGIEREIEYIDIAQRRIEGSGVSCQEGEV